MRLTSTTMARQSDHPVRGSTTYKTNSEADERGQVTGAECVRRDLHAI